MDAWIIEVKELMNIKVKPDGQGNTVFLPKVEPGQEENVRQRLIDGLNLPDWVSLEFCLISLVEHLVQAMNPDAEIIDIRGQDND